jgi:uncharacterized surface protein with fasciclin (FAS1) repeats
MRRAMATMLAAAMLVGVTALPAAASHKSNDRDFVDFIAQQAEKRKGDFNVIGQVVLALANAGELTAADVEALSTAKLTAFLPTDFAMRRLAADISGKKVWKVKESQVIPILTGALDLATIGAVVKYHIYPEGKVDYRTALKLDANKRNGTDVFITMYSGGELGIDRRGGKLQLDDAGAAGLGTNNPYVIRPNIRAGNALVHGISEVLLP